MAGGTVVYSTIHPGVVPYLGDFADSMLAQTDRDFDLRLSIDGVSDDRVPPTMTEGLGAELLRVPDGVGPAMVRQLAFSELVDSYDTVVFVDADDVLHPTRVSAAKAALEEHDVSVCALRLVDGEGCDLGRDFAVLAAGESIDDVMPRRNVVGLSNSAYRTETLRGCLPIPEGSVLVDWFLATMAWAQDASFALDPAPRMSYRQHGDNTARVVPPFSPDVVRGATRLVLAHYSLVLGDPRLSGDRRRAVAAADARVRRFAEAVLSDEAGLRSYAAALDSLRPPTAWWTIVAHPDLEATWTA